MAKRAHGDSSAETASYVAEEVMTILHGAGSDESPFGMAGATAAGPAKAVIGGSEDFYGACSIETFCDVGGLSHTHEDAEGWLNYVSQFKSANFWRKDNSVQPWIYYEDFDNWQDTYGADAVMAFYHSGHGGMAANGVFSVPMGAAWGGLGCNADSSNMRLGNEQVRYLFWSTCESLRIHDGHSPIRTWQAANLGFRMLFGFETVSWDDPNYGRFFWEEWNKSKSFSTAWLDASWRIAHDQAPAVVATGASAVEAQDRVFNERHFVFDAASANWWWWRWYDAARGPAATRERNRTLPAALLIAQLRPSILNAGVVRSVIERLGLQVQLPREVTAKSDGTISFGNGVARIAFARDGSFDARLARANTSNRAERPLRDVMAAAEQALDTYGLRQDVSLTFDRVRLAREAGASSDGSTRLEGPFTTETTVQYKQLINGLPVLTPGAGEVRVTTDNDGAVTALHSSVRQVERLSNRPANTTSAPPDPNNAATDPLPIARATASDPTGYERLLAETWTKRMAAWIVRGKVPLQYAPVPGSTEVGYDIRGNTASLIARRAVEVDFGSGIRKRYWVTVPLLE